MWTALLRGGLKGNLQDSNGDMVRQPSTDVAKKSYRLYVPRAGGQQLQASLHRLALPAAPSAVCGPLKQGLVYVGQFS